MNIERVIFGGPVFLPWLDELQTGGQIFSANAWHIERADANAVKLTSKANAANVMVVGGMGFSLWLKAEAPLAPALPLPVPQAQPKGKKR